MSMSAAAQHMGKFTGPNPDDLIFTGRCEEELTRDALQGSWERSRSAVGRPDLRLHDLRHTGLTLAAATVTTTAEIMRRAGHSSAPAALRYQHATNDRDRVLADALEVLIKSVEVIPVRGHEKVSAGGQLRSPLVAMKSPRWWPREVLTPY